MSTTADIEPALRQALPQDQQHVAMELARLVAAATEGKLTEEEAQARLNAEPSLGAALRALAGKQVEASSSVIAFGAGAQVGDVTISGDVAGGNIVKLSLNLGMQQTVNVSGQARIEKLVGQEHNTYYTYSAPMRSPQEQRNRRAMLTKLKAIWIDGFLHKSLTDELRIELNLTDRPDAVVLPVNGLYQERDQSPQPLPAGMNISEVFDRAGGELLILGAPGAGKTTLLLELLRDLLKRAEADDAHPIPVVFNLSTWAAERKPLKDWIVDQLNVIYDVPKKVGQGWVDENEALPLLDGLDEVAAEHRDDCVEAINKYRQEVGGLAPTAVASRIADYESLQGSLRLRGAVLVEPLTQQQVETYLAGVGEPLRAVRELVESDPEVMELLDSPLMLSVVTLALQSGSLETLRYEGTIGERRGRLWAAYIERMFARKGKETKYPRQQTTRRLSWLATQMVKHQRSAFFIEHLQYGWLASAASQHWYTSLDRYAAGLIYGLLNGLVYGLVGGMLGGLAVGVIVGLSGGLLFGMSIPFFGGLANLDALQQRNTSQRLSNI